MFQRSKKSQQRDSLTARSALPRSRAQPDLRAIPPFPAEIDGGLASVDPALIGEYVGVPVVAVTPPAASSTAVPTAGDGHPLSALIAGEHDARKARLRASGMSEDQIEIMVSAINDAVTQHQQNAWTVVFATGDEASVRVYPVGDSHSDFAGYKARYDLQVSAHRVVRSPLLDGRVHGIPEAHYETYRLGTVFVARGREHEAVVTAGPLAAAHAELTLAALAALGLWAVEG